jgi:glucokinase
MSIKKIISADIGGTNSRFGLFETDLRDNLSYVRSLWFKTKDAESFSHLIALLSRSNFPLKVGEADIIVIGIAGPVEQGVYSSPTSIPWDVDISHAETDYGFRRSVLINDFIAQAFATRSPAGTHAQRILQGQPAPHGTIAVIGAGTGLGKAALLSDRDCGYVTMPSEGAHASFPFVSEQEFRFQEFLMREISEEYARADNVVSGRGLSFIHQFLTGERLEPRDVLLKCTPLCLTTEWAARFYGRACRNFALETLAMGGVYIAGGVAAKSPILVTHEAFAREFRNSPIMEKVLAQIPVFLMTNEESGLWGAAVLAQQMLRKQSTISSGRKVVS